MKSTNTCPKCGSHDVIADAKAIDNVNCDLCVATYAAPDALFFNGEQRTKLSAWVCAACGFVELYADEPAALKLP
ncbi:MAG: hypothetical protein WEB58_22210 [Planctomycetaceae bacterium]